MPLILTVIIQNIIHCYNKNAILLLSIKYVILSHELLIYRRFYGNVSQDALKQLYLSLVRPHLENGCQVWNLHLVKDRQFRTTE